MSSSVIARSEATKQSTWRECKLGDVCTKITDGSHTSPSSQQTGFPMASVKDMEYNKINLKTCRLISEDDYLDLVKNDCKPKINDVLIAKDGSYLKHVFDVIKEEDVVLLSSIAIIRPNTEIVLPKFLKYTFKNPDFVNEVEANYVTGAVIPRIVLKDFRNIDISLPPIEEQKAIAQILSSLDDKIDLLHRQNHTLESLAQTLFRQWFIEEAKEEWEIRKLPDEFDFTMGLSPSGNTYNEEQNGMPMFQGNADFEFRFPSNRVYTTDPKRIAERFDTLVSVRAPVGAQNMAKEKCCIGRGVASFRYKFDNSFYTYTYYKMHSLMEEIKQFNETGTVFGSIGKSDFEAIEIVKPPFEYVAKFQNEVKPIDDKIILNCEQIKSLENLRDTLLPKLLSGEVMVGI